MWLGCLGERLSPTAGMGEFLTIADSLALLEMHARNDALFGITRTTE